MRISLCKSTDGDVVGRDVSADGEFFLKDDGAIWYRNELDQRQWFVSDDRATWENAVAAMNGRVTTVQNATEERSDNVQLRKKLSELGCLSGRSAPFWSIILEQIENGLL
ncbi:MAG: hypothetical protein QM783_08835 [Phycisphaerales bacterium]